MASVIRPGALPRRWPKILIGIVVVLFILFTVMSQFLVDMLWYREVDLSAVFWTTLWGPVGLLLATPLAVCMVVLGRHVPQLQFFEVLLGSTDRVGH